MPRRAPARAQAATTWQEFDWKKKALSRQNPYSRRGYIGGRRIPAGTIVEVREPKQHRDNFRITTPGKTQYGAWPPGVDCVQMRHFDSTTDGQPSGAPLAVQALLPAVHEPLNWK